jgi:NAD(P)H-nitrite reductase large subunit
MGHMKFEHTQPYENDFWKKNRIDLKQAFVEKIEYQTKILVLKGGEKVSYDQLVLAVGSKSNKFGWPGQDLKAVQGLYNYQDLQGMETYAPTTKRAVIVGGGLIGIEMAEMFLSRKIPVTLLVRESSFWNSVLPRQESELINRHIKEHHIDLRLSSELKEILPDSSGRVKSILTGDGEEIACEFVGLTAGVSPNVDFLKNTDLAIEQGVVVNEFLETNIPDVYSLGDCAQFAEPVIGRRPIEQVWYTGKIMGETLAQTICGNPTKYNPGQWFNSAKFLDIEYQTYGWVFAKLKENELDFYWEHPDGKKCIHFVFDEKNKMFLGVNTFGIRLRHELFDRWLNEERTIDYVLEHLKDANFDPEFYAQYEEQILGNFNRENDTDLVSKKKSWKRIFSR